MPPSAEWGALVKRAQEIDAACKQNAKDMEELKKQLSDFKSKNGGGKTKKKGFFESLLSDGDEEETNAD